METDGKNYEPPYFDPETKICHNVVEKVDYLVWHEGIHGVRRIQVWIGQIDLFSMDHLNSPYRKFIQQQFNVTFRWFGRKLPSIMEKKSLTDRLKKQGYKLGEEIRFMRIDQNHTRYEIERRNFHLGTYAKGLCDHEGKIADSVLKFGLNRYDMCRLSLNKILMNKTDTMMVDQRQQTTKSTSSCMAIKSIV
ncbi:hypothetical protein BLA29_006533, partial [Euroglyphus maynei]